MTNELTLSKFLDEAAAWICDGYSLDFRFLANVTERGSEFWDASISLNPLPAKQNLSFLIKSRNFTAGQIQRDVQEKDELILLLNDAINGEVHLPDCLLTLPKDHSLDFYSEMSHRERWFSELHLQVIGSYQPALSSMELASIDNALRLAHPPFDGLSDAALWLGLSAPGTMSNPPSIGIRVRPPVDLIFERCTLTDDQLCLTLHAHPQFDLNLVSLAVRTVPGHALESRRQVGKEIIWGDVHDGRIEGVAKIQLQFADQVLVMLMIGSSTVRRQWFLDPNKARNNRFLAIQHFDKDLKMLRQAVLESSDSAKFEKGVASLLFLLGFNPTPLLETDAPDLIVTTPSGKLVIIECTTRVADFAAKVGKLVDRRGALSKSLTTGGHQPQVSAVLVCRLPRDQIAAQANELRAHNTILLTSEDLTAGFDRIRFPNDPDQMLDEALASLKKVTGGSI